MGVLLVAGCRSHVNVFHVNHESATERGYGVTGKAMDATERKQMIRIWFFSTAYPVYLFDFVTLLTLLTFA
jgi:hypothetical protein